MDAITRAQKHIDTLEPAVSGSGGHAATFRACRILVNDYNLSLDEAWPILLSLTPGANRLGMKRNSGASWKTRRAAPRVTTAPTNPKDAKTGTDYLAPL